MNQDIVISLQKKLEFETSLNKVNYEREKMEEHYSNTVKELMERIVLLK